MAISGFPTVTGDVLTSSTMNSLVQFDVNTQTDDYTATTNDNYQEIFLMDKATAIAFKIPTNAAVAYPIGTVLTVLSIGVGDTTISAVTPGTTTVLSAGAVAAISNAWRSTNQRPVSKLLQMQLVCCRWQ
jgi:hypothetical protein